VTDKITLSDVDDDTNRTLGLLLEQLDAKQPRNVLRASVYDGKRAIRQVGTVIPPQYYRLGIVLGWCATGVDALAERCNLDRFVWPDGDLDSIGYRESWEGNHLASEIDSAIVSALIHGTSFLVNTRGDAAADEPEGLIHVKDALNATGTWNARARRLNDLLSVTGRDDEGRVLSFALYLYGRTLTAERDNLGGVWQTDWSEHAFGVPAEPVVHKPRVGRPFGSSRINRAGLSHQDAGLRELIRLEGHMDVYSFPELWMLGADASIFRNPDGSVKPDWRIMLGRIKGIPDDEDAVTPRADVKQFSASSPEPHLAALNTFAKLTAREFNLPDTALALTDVSNPTSAESYDASQYALIAKAEQATDDFDRPIRRAMLRALAMQGGLDAVPAEWLTVAAKWRSPRFLSRAAQADAGLKQLSAAPWLRETEVGLELLGLDPQQIERAMAERRRLEGRGVLAAIRAEAEARSAGAGGGGVDPVGGGLVPAGAVGPGSVVG
jgi:hypothetical protein